MICTQPILFTYVSPIGRFIDSFDVTYHRYADDMQLYIALNKLSVSGLDHLAKCTDALQVWFWSNNLQLNPDKLNAAFFGTSQRLKKSNLPTFVTVAGCSVAVSEWLKILSATINDTLDFDDHVNNVIRTCN